MDNKFGKTVLIGLILFFIIGLMFASSIFSDAEGATKVLQQQGYTEIEITGWKPFAGGDDAVSTGFKAKNAAGVTVTGTVSRGLVLKGSTIRFD